MMLKILDQYKTVFSIIEIRSADRLEGCLRTSFSWTEIPHTLCLATNKKYYRQAQQNENISGIIAPPSALDGSGLGKALIISEKADELFYYLHNQKIHEFKSGVAEQRESRIAPSARIAPTAVIGKNVLIGENVVIHDFCLVLDNCRIEAGSVLHPYVAVGSQGFFSKMILGKKTHIEHFGGVSIGKNCIIHTGTNISRSVNHGEQTILGDNVHIGIQSDIGHDCKIGSDCDISAKVFMAGRVKTGTGCWIGGAAVLSNAITLGNNANIKIGAVVIEDVPSGETVSGNFALNHAKNLRKFLKEKSE